jgi:hypothetical protein
MRQRTTGIITALWWALWTLIIVPGHTRGFIPLTRIPTCPLCPMCCAAEEAPSHSSTPAQPFQKSSDNCAICHVVAILTTAPATAAFILTLTQSPWPTEQTMLGQEASGISGNAHCRGPPTV